MQFSDHKKQMLVGKYPTEYKELVNAFLYESQERVNNLCNRFEGEEMKIGDLRALVGLAQDFAAGYKLLEGKLLPNIRLSSENHAPISEVAQEQMSSISKAYHQASWEMDA